MQPDRLRLIAHELRQGLRVQSMFELAEMCDNAADYIDHLRDLSARLATQEDKSGYHPFIARGDGKEVLISIFTDDDGSVGAVNLAFRENTWDTWSPPLEAERG